MHACAARGLPGCLPSCMRVQTAPCVKSVLCEVWRISLNGEAGKHLLILGPNRAVKKGFPFPRAPSSNCSTALRVAPMSLTFFQTRPPTAARRRG